jgi:DNA-binding transcriptional regulator YiaG
MPVSDDIKRTRKRLGESQTAFAKRFYVNQSTIHRWETGKAPIEGPALIGVETVLAMLRQLPTPTATEPAD